MARLTASLSGSIAGPPPEERHTFGQRLIDYERFDAMVDSPHLSSRVLRVGTVVVYAHVAAAIETTSAALHQASEKTLHNIQG